jgi:hypothetical protein
METAVFPETLVPDKLHEAKDLYLYIYLLTATGLSPGGSTHLHTNTT